MNRDDFQILRFEIQGLGKRFAAQIIPHADELDAAITKAFTDIAANGQLQRVVEDAALDACKDAVRG